MKAILALYLWLFCGLAAADERVVVCYNYGCSQEAVVDYSEKQLQMLGDDLRASGSAEEERDVLSRVIGRLYYWAGQQTPISADLGGNTDDDGVNGEMDCIDHSTTTTRFLQMMQRRKLLQYHEVIDVARRRRFFIFDHFSAVIRELPHPGASSTNDEGTTVQPSPRDYVVDSWFVDNGKPAVIMPLAKWMKGAGVEALATR